MSFLLDPKSTHPTGSETARHAPGVSWPVMLTAVVLVTLAASAGAETAESHEHLIIFTQPATGSTISETFHSEHLPALRDVAEQLGVPVKVLDTTAGVPEPVGITPFLVHQSPRGRSFFQGRYTDPGKVAHFIRTSRAVPATSSASVKKDIAVWQNGRSRVYAPLKITPLAGSLPEGFDEPAFQRRAEDAIVDGFYHFAKIDELALGPGDRAFYMDFYPYRSEDGRLFVSLGLFSQFNCIEPVFTAFDEPVSGSWEALDEVFARAAQALEDEVAKQIAGSAIGDGFDPIPSSVATVSWDVLGLKLPERTASENDATLGSVADLPRRWKIAPSEDGAPRLIFRFPSPLERYSGEVAELSGRLELAEDGRLQGAEGWIQAQTGSVTMGEPSLDKAIHQKMIHVAKFPASRFDLKKVLPETEELAFGRAARLQASGVFQMMGLDLPITVRGDVEPVIGAHGRPQLHVRAAFEVRLSTPFGISGPDGPEPARDTLEFYLDFLMEADTNPA